MKSRTLIETQALTVLCPTCGARPRMRCELVVGGARKQSHLERRLIESDCGMAKRQLRIVRSNPPGVIGVCEFCHKQFKTLASDFMEATDNIKIKFDDHTCKWQDSSAVPVMKLVAAGRTAAECTKCRGRMMVVSITIDGQVRDVPVHALSGSLACRNSQADYERI